MHPKSILIPRFFLFAMNNAKLITENYKRYIHNQIRDEFGFDGITVKFNLRINHDFTYCFAHLLFSGAIPSGFILGKILKKIDIREHGSKSIGGQQNVLRTLGVVPGIISLIFDFFKGFFAVEIRPASTCAIQRTHNSWI